MPSGVSLIVVCEDLLHATFARAFLRRKGFNMSRLRVERSPRGAGDAKQFVYEKLRTELQAIRRYAGPGRALLAIIDADNLSVNERRQSIEQDCQAAGIAPPHGDEPVFLAIPKWEVENWLAYLRDEPVDEGSRNYDKYRGRESDIYPLVERLADACDQGELPNAPPSLVTACGVYKRFKEWKSGTDC